MPSLFSVSESGPSGTAKTKLCDTSNNSNEIIDLATDNDIEATTVGESRPPKDLETAVMSSKSKKRRVTPNEDSGSKKKQQKKVNQMTLSNFFFQRSNNANTNTNANANAKTASTSTCSDIDKETTATEDPEEEVASASPPRKVSSANNSPSPALTLVKDTSEKDTTENHKEINDPASVMDQSQASSSTSSGGDPTERGSTEEIITSSKNEEGNVDKRKPGTETKENLGNLDSSKTALAASLETNTKTTSESLPTDTSIHLPELAVAKNTPSQPAHDASRKPTSRKSDQNEKGSSARKAKESTFAKKIKSSESPATPMVEEELSEEDLSEERGSLLRKYRKMRERYLERAHDVTHRYKYGLDEEDLGTVKLQPITDGTELKTNDANNCEDFPTQVVTNMAPLIEGRWVNLRRVQVRCIVFLS